jgi:hypothetical protein
MKLAYPIVENRMNNKTKKFKAISAAKGLINSLHRKVKNKNVQKKDLVQKFT